jgi:hypothetical protein
MQAEYAYAGPNTGWMHQVGGSRIPMARWSQETVADWLDHIGISQLAPSFKQAKIDGATLLNITKRDIDGLGIPVGSVFSKKKRMQF